MRVIPTNKVSTDNADTLTTVVELAEEMDDVFLRHGMESHALLSLSCQSNAGYAEWSMRVIPTNSVSTDNADASSAVVKLSEEMTLSSCDMVWSAMLSCLSLDSQMLATRNGRCA